MSVKEIDFEELKNMYIGDNLELIDVREDFEYVEFHLKGSKLIPMSLIPVKIEEIDFSKNVVFYCRTGGRSAMIAKMAANITGKDCFNLVGGIMGIENTGGSDLIEKK